MLSYFGQFKKMNGPCVQPNKERTCIQNKRKACNQKQYLYSVYLIINEHLNIFVHETKVYFAVKSLFQTIRQVQEQTLHVLQMPFCYCSINYTESHKFILDHIPFSYFNILLTPFHFGVVLTEIQGFLFGYGESKYVYFQSVKKNPQT